MTSQDIGGWRSYDGLLFYSSGRTLCLFVEKFRRRIKTHRWSSRFRSTTRSERMCPSGSRTDKGTITLSNQTNTRPPIESVRQKNRIPYRVSITCRCITCPDSRFPFTDTFLVLKVLSLSFRNLVYTPGRLVSRDILTTPYNHFGRNTPPHPLSRPSDGV